MLYYKTVNCSQWDLLKTIYGGGPCVIPASSNNTAVVNTDFDELRKKINAVPKIEL